MLLTPPSASNRYHVTAEHELSPELMNAIFGDVHDRLAVMEALKLDAQLAIDEVMKLSAETVVATLAEEIANGRAGLAEVRGEFSVLKDEYEAIQAGGIFASRIQIVPIDGVAGNTVQAALAAIAGLFSTQRRITAASLYLGGL